MTSGEGENGSNAPALAMDVEKSAGYGGEEEDISPIEQVRMTVSTTDDPTLPVWTFRMWFLGMLSCMLMSFLNQFFSYRTEPLAIGQITILVASLPAGHLMARVLPTTKFRLPGCGDREFSLNPGPFNMKEHVLISIFANTAYSAYGVGIIDIIRAFYRKSISFLASWILVVTTQVLGYGWAGMMRKYVVDPANMWWPGTLVQVSVFRALHERDRSKAKFFIIALLCSFVWYAVPGFLFPTISYLSWVCWVFPNSVTAQQIGSGMEGLGVGALTLDWSMVASYLGSPLVSPFFAIINVFIGYILIMYVVIPTSYWGLNMYNANKFPIFSSRLFTSAGQHYDVTSIVNDRFEIDLEAYAKEGRINLSVFFALTYGIGFATIAATISHVALFYGREIWDQFRASYKARPDIHTKLMKNYKDIPNWWFYCVLALSAVASLILCTVFNDQVQLPWWGLLFACAMAFVFTLPISIIAATTNQLVGTLIAGTINIAVAWWLLGSIENICNDDVLPPNSPWTCPSDRVFFDASVIWGLVGPRRIFGPEGNYPKLNWFFVGGFLGPVIVYIFHRVFPSQTWIPLVNLPVLLGATAGMPPATSLNYTSWIVVGTIFNYFVFRYRKKWWERYNYVLSAALDGGVAFMGVALYLAFSLENVSLDWWGADGEHCDLARCPTAKGVVVDGCPVF